MYAPQDNGTPVRDSKKMYESINKEIQEARELKQQVILLGEVGTTMQDSKEVLTKISRPSLAFPLINCDDTSYNQRSGVTCLPDTHYTSKASYTKTAKSR